MLPPISPAEPLLIVLSGPSGVGKDALLRRMKDLGKPFHYTVTLTTRPKRPNEQEGVDYIFVSSERFQHMVKQGELLEWAKVYGQYYGVPKAQVKGALKDGKDVIVKVDVQGAMNIRSVAPQGIFIFLMPPSMEELERRLTVRNTESGSPLELRLQAA
ncbi:MAG: guanylate kinase, partial [Chloroflexi bacterium]|nr:guanylate kinase [Chloroflexota bacterium]